MLSVKTRQQYLKELNLYNGKVDGITGELTRAAYIKLQKRYFKRDRDLDGVYGFNTERLLVNAYRVHKHTKNFNLEEFRCGCRNYCNGYSSLLDIDLLKNLQKVRDEFGAVTITSGIRCGKHNEAVGGITNSKHTVGKAADIKCSICGSEEGRIKVMRFWKTLPQQNYTYCNIKGSYPQMANAIHIDVR